MLTLNAAGRLIAATTIVMLAGTSLVGAEEFSAQLDEPERARICSRPSGSDPEVLALHDDHDLSQLPPYARWLETPGLQDALSAVQQRVGQRADVLGFYVDYFEKTMMVVIDPEVASSVTEHIDELVRRSAGNAAGHVKVVFGCRTVAEIAETEARVLSSVGDLEDVGISLDVPTTTVILSTLHESTEGVASGVRSWTDRVEAIPYSELQTEALLSGTRAQDASPHFGGARVRGVVQGGYCTSGVTVAWSGGWWVTTAAHCGDGLQQQYNSGSNLYGHARNVRHQSDIMVLGSTSSHQLYSRRIHTTPCAASACSRTITSKLLNPTVDVTEVCTNGSFTQAVCGLLIYDIFTSFHDGVTVQYARARRPGVDVARDGDSGGSVYGRTGTTEASARGMIQRSVCPCGPVNQSDAVRYITVRGIEAALRATIVTTGADRSS